MKIVTMLLVLNLLAQGIAAQQVFDRIYYGTAASKMNLLETDSDGILAAISWYPGISRIDESGDITYSTNYYGDSILTMASIRLRAENELYFVTGYRKDTCTSPPFGLITRTYPVIGRMDTLGNITKLHYYDINSPLCTNMPADLEILGDGGVITWGRDAMFFVLKVDSIGLPVWSRSFSGVGSFQFVRELASGGLLAGINMDTAGGVVARMDAMGNILWAKSYFRPNGLVHDCFIESDSTYYVTGYTTNLPLASTNLYLMRLNELGEVQWCKGYGSSSSTWNTDRDVRIEQTLDSNIVILATTSGRPLLIKMNMNGDTLWTKFGGASSHTYETYDLLVHSDGGFGYGGVIYGNLPQLATGALYVFKTDSLGNHSCFNRWYPTTITNMFPVDSSITLNYIDGAAAYPAFVNDTVFPPLDVYDACLITGLPEPSWKPSRLRIRPNPNPGRFTVEFKDPLEAHSFYSVYDELGRLLYQRPLPTGKLQEEIDLSQFGKGMYVLQVTDPEGVRVERVVVE
jgi:hypothetical protein